MIPAIGSLSIVVLIFGGCCSTVFALEAIIRNEPSSGLLITFLQFAFTAFAAYPSQFSPGEKYTIRKPQVPIQRWAFIAVMFFSINILNNWAFAFNISVPVHIILRSFGSVWTMLAGVVRGKRYSTLQALSVFLLTVGVLVSAWADSESKGKSMSMETNTATSEFTTGLAILLLAQLLSAYMGAYVEDTYAKYGASWTENLFYAHFLSLPLFLPLFRTLRGSYAKLAATPPVKVDSFLARQAGSLAAQPRSRILAFLQPTIEKLPQGVWLLIINAVTQLVCISGVNLLSAKASAVTVTIVLNIRKLVSFIFSTILFGHELSSKMLLGSTIVFGSGALYGWETSWRLPQHRKRERAVVEANGSVETSKSE